MGASAQRNSGELISQRQSIPRLESRALSCQHSYRSLLPHRLPLKWSLKAGVCGIQDCLPLQRLGVCIEVAVDRLPLQCRPGRLRGSLMLYITDTCRIDRDSQDHFAQHAQIPAADGEGLKENGKDDICSLQALAGPIRNIDDCTLDFTKAWACRVYQDVW